MSAFFLGETLISRLANKVGFADTEKLLGKTRFKAATCIVVPRSDTVITVSLVTAGLLLPNLLLVGTLFVLERLRYYQYGSFGLAVKLAQ